MKITRILLILLLVLVSTPIVLYGGYSTYKYFQILRCENLNRDTITSLTEGEVYDFENLSEVDLQVSIVEANEVEVGSWESKFGFYEGCSVNQDGRYVYILNGEPLYFSDHTSNEINYRNFTLYNNSQSPKSSYNFKEQFEPDIINNWKVGEISDNGIYLYNPDEIDDLILIFEGENVYYIEPEMGRNLPPIIYDIELDSIEMSDQNFILNYKAGKESVDSIENNGNSVVIQEFSQETRENWGDGFHSYCYKKPDLNSTKSLDFNDQNIAYKAEAC